MRAEAFNHPDRASYQSNDTADAQFQITETAILAIEILLGEELEYLISRLAAKESSAGEQRRF